MAVSLDGVALSAGYITSNTSRDITLGSDTTGRILVAAVAGVQFADNAYVGLSADGNAMTEITSARVARDQLGTIGLKFTHQFFWILDESATGATAFAMSGISGSDAYWVTVWELTKADTASPVGAVQTNSAAGTDQTYSIASTEAGSHLLCGLSGAKTPGAPASGVTEDRDTASGNALLWAGSRAAATATSYTVGATVTALSDLEQAAGSAIEILPDATNALTAEDLVSGTPVIEAPTIGQTHALTANDMTSAAPEIEAPSVGTVQDLIAQDLVSGTPEIEAPTAGDLAPAALTAQDLVSSAPEIEAPSVGQEHALTANDLISARPVIQSAILDPGAQFNQSARQLSVRASTSGALHHNGDWHELFDDTGIAAGGFNERFIQWVNLRLETNYTNVNSALTAWAQSEGKSRYDEISLFVA